MPNPLVDWLKWVLFPCWKSAAVGASHPSLHQLPLGVPLPAGAGKHLQGSGKTGPDGPRQQVSGLTKTQAEDLLDWLEAHGYQHLLVFSPDSRTFTVEFFS